MINESLKSLKAEPLSLSAKEVNVRKKFVQNFLVLVSFYSPFFFD